MTLSQFILWIAKHKGAMLEFDCTNKRVIKINASMEEDGQRLALDYAVSLREIENVRYAEVLLGEIFDVMKGKIERAITDLDETGR